MIGDSRNPDLTVSVGFEPLRWELGLFQSMKLLPVLVGQHYRVCLTITNQSCVALHQVRLSLQMWVKAHSEYKPKSEDLEISEIQPSCEALVYSKPYLMRDTGASDLEILRAYANERKRLTFQYQNHASGTFTYAYHVEPWRTAVLGIGISILALAVALVALTQRCR